MVQTVVSISGVILMSKQERLWLLQRPSGGKRKHLRLCISEMRREVKRKEMSAPDITSTGMPAD